MQKPSSQQLPKPMSPPSKLLHMRRARQGVLTPRRRVSESYPTREHDQEGRKHPPPRARAIFGVERERPKLNGQCIGRLHAALSKAPCLDRELPRFNKDPSPPRPHPGQLLAMLGKLDVQPRCRQCAGHRSVH